MSKALIIVDIQNDYFPEGANPLVGSQQAVDKAAQVIAHFRKNNLPLFFIQHDAGPTSNWFRTGSHGIQIHPLIKPGAEEPVIVKVHPNSFLDTDLEHRLNNNAIKELIVIGMMSHMCIDATVRAASDKGFSCTVVEDACATKDLTFHNKKVLAEDVHASFMAALGSAYAEITTTDELLRKLAS